MDYSFFQILIGGFVFILVELISLFAYQRTLYSVATNITENLTDDIIWAITMQDSSSETPIEIISLINNDIEQIFNKYIINIYVLIKLCASFVLFFIYLSSINIMMSIIIIFLGLVGIILPKLFIKKGASLKASYSSESSKFSNVIKELLYGLNTIRLFGIQKLAIELTFNQNENRTKARARSDTNDALIELVGMTTGFVVLVINVIFAGYLSYQGYFSIGTVLAVMQVMNNVIMPLSQGPAYLAQIKLTKPIIDKALGYIKENKEDFISFTENFEKLELKNISYSYENGNMVLNNINLTFERGKNI